MRKLSLILLAVLTAAAARATTIVMPADDQLIAKSPVIVSGSVTTSYAVDRGGMIWTETTVAVDRILKGNAAPSILVATPGGELDGRITKIYGAPEFTDGERVLLFLEPHAAEYRVMDLFAGKMSEAETRAGQRLWVRDDQRTNVTLLDADFQPIESRNVQRDATRFESFLAARLRGEAGANNYGVENPVLAKPVLQHDGMTANFTLISEPTVYRWFTFEQGGSAAWYSHGTQPGYTGGGTSEIQTAMDAWNSYASAKIRYTFGGAASGTPAGLSRANGVNEVLFNDPLNEISGTWNRSTGGVVGQGGFNGVTSGGTWTAPFAADTSHPAGSIRAYNITEGNLTIQDGVSSSTGISSNRLAEIIAHEFGHTLGFGHSADSTALMYATVTGLGPSLRADDQLAARWLYPNGTQQPNPTPTVPSAPSALSATASGSSIALTWNDNATNETGYSVYLAGATGAFSKVTDLAANSRSATLNGLAAGSYRIYVVAFNSAGNSTASNTATATIASTTVPLVASFTFTPSTGTAGATTFAFTDSSTGGVTAWRWAFGDGAISTLQNPTHLFASAGTYSVILTVYRNSETATTARNIIVANGAPQTPAVSAAFNFSPAAPVTGENVSFVDASSGAPTSWAWNFGDGTTSTQQNPSHAYANSGTYTVALSAKNAATQSTVTRTVVVTARQAYRSLVPVTAQTAGANGTSWRTELSIFNPTKDTASVTFTFVPGAGGSIRTRVMSFGPQATATIENALLQLFGISSGSGALAIEATSNSATTELKISSRTYTGGSAGTYGQAVPDVQAEELEQTLYLTGIASNAAFRTNLGLVNRGNSTTSATLTLLNADGSTLATTNVTLPASNFQQAALGAYFPAVNGGSYNALSLRITAISAGAVSGYASVVDNVTQDPIYIQAIPAATGGSLTLPAVGRVAGANGTYWRSDVTFFNPSRDRLVVNARFLAAGADNRNVAAKSLVLNGGETVVVADLLNMMGISSGNGALEVFWSGATGPVVSSRTYTTVTTGGTYGQSIDPLSSFARDIYVPGLRADGSYRSNAGFVNGSSDSIPVTVRLLASTGQELASTTITLAPKSQQQYSVNALFPNVNTAGVFTLHAATSAGAKLFAYGSMVDNGSGDPVFFAGR